MTQNKKRNTLWVLSILTALSFTPVKAHAFLTFCFPISFTILSFVLGWPSMVIYELLPKSLSQEILNGRFTGTFVIGFIIDLIIILLIGFWLDKRKRTPNLQIRKKYLFKIPFYFTLVIVLLVAFMFVDPSCNL